MKMKWKNKRVFVSGGSGVIGTALVEYLLDKGAAVFVGDLKPRPEGWDALAGYREGDLNSLTLREIQDFNPEVFFHLAAAFERSVETPDFWDENFHHNIKLSHHLLSLHKELSSLKKIVFASSYLIYDPNDYLFETPQVLSVPLSETNRPAPRNLCGMSKMFHEQELHFVKTFRPNLQIINARIFRSYGKNSRDIISRWIRALIKHEKMTVYCPEGRFDFVYAEDVAKGLLSLAETDFSGTVNLGSGKSRSIFEVLEVLKQQFGQFNYQNETTEIPFEASQADTTLFHQWVKDFSFQPLEKAIPQIISFEKREKM
jgi:carbamoyl-phosphate synthase large subunit